VKPYDIGILRYSDAWQLQEQFHDEVASGGEERLLLVEHPPVITFGRRPHVQKNLVATEDELAEMGVGVVQSDRGGDITFHGPGQLVAYPIVRLADHRLLVGSYMRKLQQIVIEALAEFGVTAQLDPSAVGVWTRNPQNDFAKICAFGVRIRRGVSMHGIALNVSTDLRYFNLIVPCGLAGRPVTSLAEVLGDRAPAMDQVKEIITHYFLRAFAPQGVASNPPPPPQ
jgi:lipoyl(octanoyl) transferase